jgi:hypothetical protein
MTFILKKPELLDALSTRWIEPAPGLRIKVASAAKEGYKSDYRMIMRHVAAMSSQNGIGTPEFSVLNTDESAVFDSDALFIELASKHLIVDWEGVAEAEDPSAQTPYTPERGVLLLQQLPRIYYLVMAAAQAIALRQEEQAVATVGKPSTPTDGQPSGRGKKTTASDKSAKS